MKNELNNIIERYKNSQTTLEAYQAISDFVEIIIEVPAFIKQVRKEWKKIRIAQEELSKDKGWNYGLRGTDLKEHNAYRDRKGKALHQLDPMFPLRNLNHIRLGIQLKHIAGNSVWLFRWSGPDEPLRESDRKEFQLYIDKLYKKILPFLENETNEKSLEEIKVRSYDEKTRILTIGNYEIRIAKNEGNNKAHEIMVYIFIDKKDDLGAKFYYSEIADERFKANYDGKSKYAHQPYSGACQRINQIVKDETNGKVKEFLLYNHSKLGFVQVNPKYLEIKQKSI